MAATRTIERSKQALTLYAEWPMRIVFASIFLFHGLDKLTGGVDTFAGDMGISTGIAWMVPLSELVAGSFVFIGGFSFPYHAWFTRIGAAASIPVMIGAISLLHWPRWHFAPAEGFPLGGMMFQVTLILVALYLIASTGRIREHFQPQDVPEDADNDVRLRIWANNLPIGAHWFLRIAIASVFLFMGFDKFGTLETFSEMMGLSQVTSFIVAFVECAAGILILVGGTRTEFADNASRVAGLLIFPIMIGAIAKVNGTQWSFAPSEVAPMGGAEFQTLLIMIGLFFTLRGRPEPGPVTQTQTTGA